MATPLKPEPTTATRMPGSAGFTNQIDGRAEVGVLLAELEAALKVGRRDDVGLQQAVPLEVGQGLEEDARTVDDLEASTGGVTLQRVQRIGAAVAMLGLSRRDGGVVVD